MNWFNGQMPVALWSACNMCLWYPGIERTGRLMAMSDLRLGAFETRLLAAKRQARAEHCL